MASSQAARNARAVFTVERYVTIVDLDSPPATLTAGANTELTFEATVYVVTMQNNSGEDKRVKFPSPAGPGSWLVPDAVTITFSAGDGVLPREGATSMGIHGASATPLNDDDEAVGVIVNGRA